MAIIVIFWFTLKWVVIYVDHLHPKGGPLISWRSWSKNFESFECGLLSLACYRLKCLQSTWSMGISRPGNFSSVYLSLTAASSFGVIAVEWRNNNSECYENLLSVHLKTRIHGSKDSGSISPRSWFWYLLLVSISFSLNHELNCSLRTLVKTIYNIYI